MVSTRGHMCHTSEPRTGGHFLRPWRLTCQDCTDDLEDGGYEEARYDGVGVRHAEFSRVVKKEDRKHSIVPKRWGTSASAFLEFTVMANSCPRPVRSPSVLFPDG